LGQTVAVSGPPRDPVLINNFTAVSTQVTP
jgi:hypothetical protein